MPYPFPALDGSSPKTQQFNDVPEMGIDPSKRYTATMETSMGTLVIALDPIKAPKTVNNFVFLSKQGFYDGLTFHRVIPGFMIQGGDPTGSGSGDGPRKLKAEFSTDPQYKHSRGVLSMARSASPDSASCQFFVMHAASPNLDGKYSAFEKVYEGLEAEEDQP